MEDNKSYYIGDCTNASTVEEKYYVGTDLKFAIDITADGFDMGSDDYTCTLSCGSQRVVVSKSDITEDENGQHYLLIDTTQFPSGVLRWVVTASVPDGDFVKGYRNEVEAIDLCEIKHPW